ncbi:MAG: hypothetical protein IT483_08250, partial [Gammaproteobacteria bacterium]|nr:hypothetical protein [Gammaproteobacteria bacterium]
MADFDPGPELEALLGARRVAELRQLAAAAPRRASGCRVFILPGIMGSTLGAARKLLPDDLLWFDPVEIALGRLTDLVPPARRRLEARGALLFGYLRLKLLLRAAGHDATILPYDWRHSVRTAAAALARRMATAPEGTALVAHSQGGLVARALLAHPESKRLGCVVQLGTPNRGAFAAVQALRGSYPLVRRLARLDLAHDAGELADRVFTKLAGLAELLPDTEACERFDPFDAGQWPAGPRPDSRLLFAAQAVRATLPAPDARFRLVAGFGRDTPTGLRLSRGALEFSSSQAGDGTVPLALACLPGLATYYSTAAHGELPTDANVGRAVLDLLEGTTTQALPTTPPVARGPLSWRRETTAPDAAGKLFWDDLSPPERLDFLHEFVTAAPVTVAARAPARARQPLPLKLLQAEAVDVRSEALVLAMFEQVDPAGATL